MIPSGEGASRPGFEVPERCRLVGEVLSRIGDKWSVMVILSLADGGRRAPVRRAEALHREHLAAHAHPYAA